MRASSFSVSAPAVLLSLALSALAVSCYPTTLIYSCPSGSYDDGTGAGTCLSEDLTLSAGVVDVLGTATPTFYYLGFDLGYVLGTGASFTFPPMDDTAAFIPDTVASFGQGPTLSALGMTESFNSVAIYSEDNGEELGLSGYIVAAGHALAPSGNVLGLIARFSPDGALDPSFGDGYGYVLTGASGFTGGSLTVIRSVAIDSQGRIIVGGYGNSQPQAASSYLEALAGGNLDPHDLPGVGLADELLGFVARYDSAGELDLTFSAPLTVPAPAAGSAANGFAVSPSLGYGGTSSAGDRMDLVLGVAVDSADGIFAVGSSADSFGATVTEAHMLLHFESDGTLDDDLISNYGAGREYYASVRVDSSDYATIAGSSITSGQGILARVYLNASGVLTHDAAGFAAPDGYVVPAAANTTDEFLGLTIDASGTIIVAGRADGDRTLLRTFTSAGVAADTELGPMAGYATGSNDSLYGVAALGSGADARYLSVGFAEDGGGGFRSLIASSESDLTDASDFESNPYVNSVFGVPTMYASPAANTQLGLNTGAYAGGDKERFTAIAPSADGTYAVVVGFSSIEESLAANTTPATGRIFPILLYYSIDGTFPNLAQLEE